MNNIDASHETLREIIQDGNLLHIKELASSEDVGMDENGHFIDIENNASKEMNRLRKRLILEGDLSLEKANEILETSESSSNG